MFRLIVLVLLFAVGALAPPGRAAPSGGQDAVQASDRTTYVLRSSVVGAAGCPGTSTLFQADGTLGQSTPVGVGASSGLTLYSGFWNGMCLATAVPEGEVPGSFQNVLFQNVPNPFNPLSAIRFEVKDAGPVEITVYSVVGRAVRTLIQGKKGPGEYEVLWDGRDDRGDAVASGVYLYRLQVGDFQAVRKMVLLR